LLASLTAAGLSEPPALQRVVYLGRVSAQQDRSVGSFWRAVENSRPGGTQGVVLEFLDVGVVPDERSALAVSRMALTQPKLLVAPNADAAGLASRWAPSVPLVFSTYVNPVALNLVSTLSARPEPRTGVWVTEHLDAKRLEALHDAYPEARRVAVLSDRSWNQAVDPLAPVEKVAASLGLQVTILLADSAPEVARILDSPQARGFDAWVVPRSYGALQAMPAILSRLREWRKPVILGSTADVLAGAPLSYAVDTKFIWPALADLSLRILAGEAAGSLPIQRPQRFVLAVRTGADTGLPTPDIALVRRADLVIR
jgi:putative ABC transport system substrate-binding protein